VKPGTSLVIYRYKRANPVSLRGCIVTVKERLVNALRIYAIVKI